MNRRGAPVASQLPVARVTVLLLGLLLSVATLAPATLATAGEEPPPTEPEPEPEPTTTFNDFFPEQENLSDCLGSLERPGCGSKSRGGWRQTVTFSVMAAGLLLVFGRIAWAVRKSSKAKTESA